MNETDSHERHIAAKQRLSSDELANLMTLKMLNLFPENCETTLFEDRSAWACLTELDVAASFWDRATYPHLSKVVLIDGDSERLLARAFAAADKDNVVFKVHSAYLKSLLAGLPGARCVQSFLSCTRTPPDAGEPDSDPAISESSVLTPDAIESFSVNGYTPEELHAYFVRGARLFNLDIDGKSVSRCFIFLNYGEIWEIAGVYTEPESRKKGYAQRLVRHAVLAIEESGGICRYQFKSDNSGSRAVARAVGLDCFLEVDHWVRERMHGEEATAGYRVREAIRDEYRLLPTIERAANELFGATEYGSVVETHLTSEQIDSVLDLVWVVTDSSDTPVGFAMVRKFGIDYHLREIDVDPCHGRRGLGRLMIDEIAGQAREQGARALTLTTFRDVPWNAPYYRRLGFREIEHSSLSAELVRILESEAAAGLPMARRVCMRMDIVPGVVSPAVSGGRH